MLKTCAMADPQAAFSLYSDWIGTRGESHRPASAFSLLRNCACRRKEQRRKRLRQHSVPARNRLFCDKDHIVRTQLETRGKRKVRSIARVQVPRRHGTELTRARPPAQHIKFQHVAPPGPH